VIVAIGWTGMAGRTPKLRQGKGGHPLKKSIYSDELDPKCGPADFDQ
jgi:hypothetical protein